MFLKALQRDLGITFIYVTHDQEEALTMSDRMAVFNEGRVEQLGSPADVYEHPQTEFVAGFVGVSNMLDRNGRKITIRPEKIHMRDDDGGSGEPGVVREVVYAGMVTRYVVDLDRAASSSSSAKTSRPRPSRRSKNEASVSASNGGRSTPTKSPRRETDVKRITRGHVLLAAIAAALCVPAAGISRGTGLPTSIGKGEGSLNVIEWAAYWDPSFANKFQTQTGCIIHRKDAGSSNEMVALMRSGGGGGGGQYDLVSASGDASLRLIYGGDVQPVNVNLIPSWKQFLPNFRSPAHNTVKGVHYGVSVQWGPNTLIYNTKLVKPAPTSWSAIYSSKYKGKVTVPNNPIQIADAALYLMKTQPKLGIKDPYELTKAQLELPSTC